MTLPSGVNANAKGRYAPAYFAGVANILGNYGQARQASNSMQGAVAMQTIGALTQSVMAGFDSYRQYRTEREKIQYERDRSVMADRQWQLNYERALKQDAITNAHLALEDERMTMELVKLRRATELEAPTMAAKMGFASGSQEIRASLSKMRTDNVINTEAVKEARGKLEWLREGLLAQSRQYPGMNLSEEFSALEQLDKGISEASMIRLGDEPVSIASVSAILDMAPTNEADVQQLVDLSRSKEVDASIRTAAAKRVSELKSMSSSDWSSYNELPEMQKKDLHDYAVLATDSFVKRRVDAAAARGDASASLHSLVTGRPDAPVSPAGTLDASTQQQLSALKKPISYHSSGNLYKDQQLSPSVLAEAVAEASADVSDDVLFGDSREGRAERASALGLYGRWNWGQDIAPSVVSGRVAEFTNRSVAAAALSSNATEQRAYLTDLQQFLASPRLQAAVRGKSSSPNAPVFSELFSTQSAPVTLGLMSLTAAQDPVVASLAKDLIATYSPRPPAGLGVLTVNDTRGGAPINTAPPPISAPAPTGKAAMPGSTPAVKQL